MAKGKKGALYQLFVPMVDGTDFASVESAITASDFNSGVTAKFYGMNHGGSAATTSGTISKAASLVRSGVFRITLKTTENNYDVMMARFNKTGCAEQIFVWENVDNDDSDLLSAITVAQSMASDAASAAQQGNSRVLVIQSRLSDFDSRLVSDVSDIRSAIALLPTAVSASDMSDIASRVWATAIGARVDSRILLIQSMASDAHSAAILAASNASEAQSQATLGASRALVIQSRLSDLDSRLVSDLSDVRSAIALIPVSVSASDMSDIASRVWAEAIGARVDSRMLLVQSLASDAHSAAILGASTASLAQVQATAAASRALLVQSALSDVQSYLVGLSGLLSDTHSAAILGASHASDAISAANVGASRALVVQSRLSDLDSRLVSDLSDVRSAIALLPTSVSASDMSDIASMVWAAAIGARVDSRLLVAQSMASDAHSAATVAGSRALIVQSRLSDLDSRLALDVSDLASKIGGVSVTLTASDISDIASAVAAAVTTVTASDISDIASAVWAHATGARVDSRVLVIQSIASNAHSAALLGASTASDAGTAATAAASRALILQSRLSDLDSRLASDLSDVRSALALVPTSISASDLSDVASAVWAHTIGARVDSRLLVAQSAASDAHSAAAQASSRALVVQSHASDIYSLLSNLHADVATLSGVVSDVQSALAVGVDLGASSLSDLRSAITANGLLAAGVEPTAGIAHTDSRGAKLDWLAALAKNKQTLNKDTGLGTLRNSADDSTVSSRTDSDDGSVYTKGAWS